MLYICLHLSKLFSLVLYLFCISFISVSRNSVPAPSAGAIIPKSKKIIKTEIHPGPGVKNLLIASKNNNRNNDKNGDEHKNDNSNVKQNVGSNNNNKDDRNNENKEIIKKIIQSKPYNPPSVFIEKNNTKKDKSNVINKRDVKNTKSSAKENNKEKDNKSVAFIHVGIKDKGKNKEKDENIIKSNNSDGFNNSNNRNSANNICSHYVNHDNNIGNKTSNSYNKSNNNINYNDNKDRDMNDKDYIDTFNDNSEMINFKNAFNKDKVYSPLLKNFSWYKQYTFFNYFFFFLSPSFYFKLFSLILLLELIVNN